VRSTNNDHPHLHPDHPRAYVISYARDCVLDLEPVTLVLNLHLDVLELYTYTHQKLSFLVNAFKS